MENKEQEMPRTCVAGDGTFLTGCHRPSFGVDNFRENDFIETLGRLPDGVAVDNRINFPADGVNAVNADIIYEIPNAFPFKGTTYINSRWADAAAKNPEKICLPPAPDVSLSETLEGWGRKQGVSRQGLSELFEQMPSPLRMALAQATTDPEDLVRLAHTCCTFVMEAGRARGLCYKPDAQGRPVPDIQDHELFEVIANNRCLPDAYKQAMVLRPGVQGGSEITAEWDKPSADSHVFEYLRRNSYIPWGHFAANTADDTVRYRIADLTGEDMTGMRHLCYQRVYVMLARQLGLPVPPARQRLSGAALESLRVKILDALSRADRPLEFNGSLWGWNFGFGYCQSGYRLHASHQQIHQQYAMIPRRVTDAAGASLPSYACGDLQADFVRAYRRTTGRGFFGNYLRAIRSNQRVDGDGSRPRDLVVYADENIILFVPKAQTSQWELQLMPQKPCGNILEADGDMRKSIDTGMMTALRVLERLGARMVSCIEYAARFDAPDADQRLLYAFLPRLPHSPGAFSEAQLRWITGHYPEDFALACRHKVTP